MIGPDDDTHVGGMPSGSSVPARLVLGVGLLLIGIGNVLAIDLVLLPRYLGGMRAGIHRTASVPVPIAAPARVLPAAGTVPPPPPQPVPAVRTTPVAEPAAGEPHPEATPAPLPALLFPQNTAWLSPTAHSTLTALAALLAEKPSLKVKLAGHTDDQGPERINRLLSIRRAQRVSERLQLLGIDASRIDAQGFGSTQPADDSRTAQGRARNRRVEITLH